MEVQTMRCKELVMLTMVGILSATSMLSGCSANRISLADQGLVSVEKQASEKVKILWTDVYGRDGQTWVYGVLKQRTLNPGAIKSHVDINVSALDGSVYYETVSEDIYIPRNRVGKGINWERFKVQLPVELSDGSKISITVHSGSHKQVEEKS
jgi:hypothetical protein